MRNAKVLPLAFAIAFGPGCAPREAADDAPPPQRVEAVVIEVHNQNPSLATVFLREEGGIGVRLGEVPSQTVRYFQQDLWLGRPIRFDIRILAGSTHRTEAILASPGDTVQLVIPWRP
jgi:hypothetical protein